MKKIKFKKILSVVLWVGVLAGIIVTLGFVNIEEKKIRGKSVTINISNTDENYFIDEEDVLDFLRQRKDTVINQPITEINVYELEKALNAHPVISNAEVSVDVNGAVNIDLHQRKPIVRLFNYTGESYYIDDKAKLMPLSSNYTARVLVANGFIYEKYAQFCNYRVNELLTDTVINKITVLDDIYNVASFIVKDTLLNNLIQQIYINEQKEIELLPLVGGHKILFGDGSEIADKFNKLKIFYKEGLNSVNDWNKYATVNLKYRDQVICTKK